MSTVRWVSQSNKASLDKKEQEPQIFSLWSLPNFHTTVRDTQEITLGLQVPMCKPTRENILLAPPPSPWHLRCQHGKRPPVERVCLSLRYTASDAVKREQISSSSTVCSHRNNNPPIIIHTWVIICGDRWFCSVASIIKEHFWQLRDPSSHLFLLRLYPPVIFLKILVSKPF